jgi:hypothetical protein
VKSTEPVTISGFWYSSPIFFQKSTLAKMPSSGCRSFSSRICCASPGFGAFFAPAGGRGARAPAMRMPPAVVEPLDPDPPPFEPPAVRAAVRGRCGVGPFVGPLFVGQFQQRQHVGVDHAERGLRAELAAEQANGLEVGVHVLGSAGEEARR